MSVAERQLSIDESLKFQSNRLVGMGAGTLTDETLRFGVKRTESQARSESTNQIVEASAPLVDRQTELQLAAVNEEIKQDLPLYERVLNWAASPFAIETGFYFRGKKAYHCQPCGVTTLIGLLFLFASFIVLFGPVLIGSTIQSELKIVPFNTPADIPANDSVPNGLAQFFGRQVPREKPILDLQEFTDQFYQVHVYGASACKNTARQNDILLCSAVREGARFR